MEVVLNNIGKRFNHEWIFRNLSYCFTAENPCVITGANGSGKSTLLQAISSATLLSEGEIIYKSDNNKINTDEVFKHISIATPYLELVEEFKLDELIAFHKNFKPFLNSINSENIIEIMQLEHAKSKYIKQFSSGMKQRVKLALAILSNTPILLLDEPCSNLDIHAIEWYQKLIANYGSNRIIIVSSNSIKDEYFFCTKEINMGSYKINK